VPFRPAYDLLSMNTDPTTDQVWTISSIAKLHGRSVSAFTPPRPGVRNASSNALGGAPPVRILAEEPRPTCQDPVLRRLCAVAPNRRPCAVHVQGRASRSCWGPLN